MVSGGKYLFNFFLKEKTALSFLTPVLHKQIVVEWFALQLQPTQIKLLVFYKTNPNPTTE